MNEPIGGGVAGAEVAGLESRTPDKALGIEISLTRKPSVRRVRTGRAAK